jgi:hypothetical protein
VNYASKYGIGCPLHIVSLSCSQQVCMIMTTIRQSDNSGICIRLSFRNVLQALPCVGFLRAYLQLSTLHWIPQHYFLQAHLQLSTSHWIPQHYFPTIRPYHSTENFTANRILCFLLPISPLPVGIALARGRLLPHYGYHPQHQDCQHFVQRIHETSLHPLGNCSSCM